MPTLEKKKAQVEEIIDNLENSQALYIANYSGLSVPDINELRSEFAEDGLIFRVYKNTLVERAMEEVGGYEDLYPHLHNQNAFAFAEEELAKPAKILKKFNEEHKKPEFKAALIDGGYYGPDQLGTLAAMKSKEEVIGEIVSLLQAPVSNVISALQAQGENIAGAVKEIAEKGGEIGSPEEADTAEAEESDADEASEEAAGEAEEADEQEDDTEQEDDQQAEAAEDGDGSDDEEEESTKAEADEDPDNSTEENEDDEDDEDESEDKS